MVHSFVRLVQYSTRLTFFHILSAGRAQEWRNLQWTPRQLRQLYEHHAPRGIPDECRRRPLLESQRVLHPR